MISDSDIERVSAATDFVALASEIVPVKRRGRDFWCCCPFHKEKTPSCKIDVSQNIWHCFGCGEGGTVFTFVMKAYNMSFVESVHFLADRAHIEIEDDFKGGMNNSEKNKLRDCCSFACNFFEEQLLRGKSESCDAARAYLSKRKLNVDIAKKWHLGFAVGHGSLCAKLLKEGFTDDEIVKCNLGIKRRGQIVDRFFNRIMFPIFDIQRNCVAFGGRVIGKGEPKYLNSSESPIFHKSKVLYGIDKAKNAIVSKGFAIVVEGYTDVIAMHEAGFDNTVATLGTALTLQHIKLLGRYASTKIVYLFDGDEAGQRAAERALQFIDYSMTPEAGQARCDLHAVVLPDNLDPADFLEKFGQNKMDDALKSSRPLIEFGINRKLSKHDLTTAEGRSRALVDAISILSPIKDSILARDYAANIASKLRISEKDAQNTLAKLKSPKTFSHESITINPSVASNAAPHKKSDKVAPQSPSQKNRLKNEKELIALCIQNPQFALLRADDIINIKWQSKFHKMIVDEFFKFLNDDMNATKSALMNHILASIPESSSVVTSTAAASEEEANETFQILINNVLAEDLKSDIDNLTISLSTQNCDENKRNEIMHEIQSKTEKIISLQKF